MLDFAVHIDFSHWSGKFDGYCIKINTLKDLLINYTLPMFFFF